MQYTVCQLFVCKISTLAIIKQLVKVIGTLSNSLLDSVPKGMKDNKIWEVMNSKEQDTPHETFNQRFDALFVIAMILMIAFTLSIRANLA